MENEVNKKEQNFQPMSVGAWICTLILVEIPFVGWICQICWFFGVGNRSRVNFVRALVVIEVIVIVLVACFYSSIITFLASWISSLV